MKQNISKSMFHDEFNKIRPGQFTYDGLDALYEYLVDVEESTGEEIELDVIAICCDFIEYPSIEEIKKERTANISDLHVIEIEFDTGIIIRNS